jgi:hypothetical protein
LVAIHATSDPSHRRPSGGDAPLTGADGMSTLCTKIGASEVRSTAEHHAGGDAEAAEPVGLHRLVRAAVPNGDPVQAGDERDRCQSASDATTECVLGHLLSTSVSVSD